MDLILLLGLLILWASHHRMRCRLAHLEHELERFRPGVEHTPAGETSAVGSASPAEVQEMVLPPLATSAQAVTSQPVEAAVQEQDLPESISRETFANLFERFVGGSLLIWIGGIALAVAGIFLVGYSIEIGLMTPPVRMIMAAIFGLLLLGVGEYARARPGAIADHRVAQALVGAGILVLYAAPYGSLVLYGLISMWTASILMVTVTAVALVLSLRHGAPTAVMGLAGGFATPLLVGDPAAGVVPLLAYVALLDFALFTLARKRGWSWLAAGAVLLSFAWTSLYLLGAPQDALAAGLFVLVLSIIASSIRAGTGWQLDFIRPAAIGLVQLALLVGRTDIGLPGWALFCALAAASFFLAGRRIEYHLLPALALLLALVLIAVKAAAGEDPLIPAVAAVMSGLFAAGGVARALRGDLATGTAISCCGLAGPVIILRVALQDLLSSSVWAGLFFILAVAALLLAWWKTKQRHEPAGEAALAIAAATCLVLGFVSVFDLVRSDLVGGLWLALAAATAFAARTLDQRRLTDLTLAATAVACLWIVAQGAALWIVLVGAAAGQPALAADLPGTDVALRSFLLPVPVLLLIWHWLPRHRQRTAPAVMAAAGALLMSAAYVLFKQSYGLASSGDFQARGFGERLIITQTLFLCGWVLSSGRASLQRLARSRSQWIGTLLTALAAARLLWFDVIIHNPALTTQYVGHLPLLNLLVPAYLASAAWLFAARRQARHAPLAGVCLGLFLTSLIVGVLLIVRQLFQGVVLTAPSIPAAESYGYSLAGLLLSVALMLAGIRMPDKALRLAGLVLLTATILKAFLIDAAVLEGLLRILSFLGLGIALIGIGKLYAAVLSAEQISRPSGLQRSR